MKPKNLLFALRLKDEFAPLKPLVGSHNVDLIGRNEKAIINNSGLYCFRGMAAGHYSIAVSARYYCDKIVEVDTRSMDPKMPAVDVCVSPNLNYPFPKGTTLARGTVNIKGDSDSIASGVRVRVRKSDKQFYTDECGRFIFYFNENKEDEEEEQVIKLVFTKSGFITKRRTCKLLYGDTRFVNLAIEPER